MKTKFKYIILFHNFSAELVVCDGRIQATSKIHFAIAYDIVFEGYVLY